jgi:transposase
MRKKVRFLGLDVHAETIAVAVAEPDGEVRSLGTIPNRVESIRKLVKKLGSVEQLQACYEAGPTGYVLYWQLAELGVKCEVIAPTLVPVKAGNRVKTDRRDAEKLARSYRSDDLTAVWVPDEGSEALRDLVRAREAAKQDQLRARNRLSKFLLRSGQRPAPGVKPWTQIYMAWIRQIHFAQMAQESTRLDYLSEVEHMGERVVRLEQAIAEAVKLASPELQEVIKGLQALRGIAPISAVTLAAELGQISRFEGARQLMGYSGAVPSEDSSGKRTQRGSITKTGARTKENPRNLYATGSAGLATLVRGSSRRITIMRFRPANIRLINRRSNLPRPLLALSPKNNKCNDNDENNHADSQRLTRSLHIRDLAT